MKYYGIWVVEEEEWLFMKEVVYHTTSHAVAVAQKAYLEKYKHPTEVHTLEIREFPEY